MSMRWIGSALLVLLLAPLALGATLPPQPPRDDAEYFEPPVPGPRPAPVSLGRIAKRS